MARESTLCWECQNAVPSANTGCPWSREFKPVEGWEAETTTLIIHGKGPTESYHIIKCPLFVPDARVMESGVKGITWCKHYKSWRVRYKDKSLGYRRTLSGAKALLSKYRKEVKS